MSSSINSVSTTNSSQQSQKPSGLPPELKSIASKVGYTGTNPQELSTKVDEWNSANPDDQVTMPSPPSGSPGAQQSVFSNSSTSSSGSSSSSVADYIDSSSSSLDVET